MIYPFIDFHTHNPKQSKQHFCIHSLLIEEYENNDFPSPFTFGVHPWWADEINQDQYYLIYNKVISHPNYIGMGEIGLDKIKDDNWSTQIDMFKMQLEIAKMNQHEFIIIHCVKAFNEVIRHIKSSGYKGNIVFHDYHENEVITKELIKRDAYFSFGKALNQLSKKLQKSLSIIPINKILIETDDNEGIDIEVLYQNLADYKNISLLELKKQIYENTIAVSSNIKKFIQT
jgi:TatD DNase family protein